MKALFRGLLWPCCLAYGTAAVSAQTPSSLEFEVRAGSRDALIESICSGRDSGQVTFGGAFRYHVTSRTSIGPEFSYIRPCDRQVFTFQHPRSSGMLQIVHDFRNGRVRPYVLAAIGVVHHESQYASSQNKVEAAGGGGLKFFVTRRVFIAPEIQVNGGVATLRSSLGVGFIIH